MQIVLAMPQVRTPQPPVSTRTVARTSARRKCTRRVLSFGAILPSSSMGGFLYSYGQQWKNPAARDRFLVLGLACG